MDRHPPTFGAAPYDATGLERSFHSAAFWSGPAAIMALVCGFPLLNRVIWGALPQRS